MTLFLDRIGKRCKNRKLGLAGALPLAALLAAALFSAGCARTVVLEGTAPPLLPVPKDVHPVAIGEFRAVDATPAKYADAVRADLASAIQAGGTYAISEKLEGAPTALTGRVKSAVTEAQRPPDAANPRSAPTRARVAEVFVEFIVSSGDQSFAVKETPAPADVEALRRRSPGPDKLQRELLRSCVRTFVADISPRPVRAALREPGVFSDRETRRAIGLLKDRPADAVDQLIGLVDRNPRNAPALNALGACSEMAGDLERAYAFYSHAITVDPRPEYRENAERTFSLLAHREKILPGKPSEGQAEGPKTK